MLATWTKGTGGNFFPMVETQPLSQLLKSQTNATQIDRVGVQEPP